THSTNRKPINRNERMHCVPIAELSVERQQRILHVGADLFAKRIVRHRIESLRVKQMLQFRIERLHHSHHIQKSQEEPTTKSREQNCNCSVRFYVSNRKERETERVYFEVCFDGALRW